MGKLTLLLVVANVVAIATWVALRVAWFDGSIGCDDEGGSATAECYRRSDALAYLAWGEMALLALTVLWVVGRGAFRRLSTRRP